MRDELKLIKKIRATNNDLWMQIVDIALRHAPDETKKVMMQIADNDVGVTACMRDIVNED